MRSNPLTTFPLFAAMPLPGGPLRGDIFVMPNPFDTNSLFAEIPLPADPLKKEFNVQPNPFTTSSLFAPTCSRLDLRNKAANSEEAQVPTEFPYPFFIDEEEEKHEFVFKVKKSDAPQTEEESDASATFLFPQPKIYRNEPANRFGRKLHEKPAFFRGARLFARFR